MMKCWRQSMHELAICQSLISQVEDIAKKHQSKKVISILVQIGPLSGAEAPLIKSAYPIAAAGTVAEQAILEIETMPIRVRCNSCQEETIAKVNRLICGKCGDFHTELLSGDEMLLASLELDSTIH